MFTDILAESNGTDIMDPQVYFDNNMGIQLDPNRLARYPEVATEITDEYLKYTDTQRNSLGYRCDEFIERGDGLHIVFSGCSTTYGSGLSYDDTWAKQVYDGLSTKYKVGPYINIARPASSLFNIISQAFKYINEFGKPDILAISFPSIFRGYNTSEEGMIYNSHWPEWFLKKAKDLRPVTNSLLPYVNDYLSMLVLFCKTNNIKLYMFTWESEPERMGIQTYSALKIVQENFINYGSMIADLYGNRKYADKSMLANDDAHLGKAFHNEFARKMLEAIGGDLKNENSGH